MKIEIGERVGAIASANKDKVYLFGYGVYEGRHPFAVFGDDFEIPNPRILLDSGKRVHGAQCWWGKEDVIKKKIGNRKVIMVDILEDKP